MGLAMAEQAGSDRAAIAWRSASAGVLINEGRRLRSCLVGPDPGLLSRPLNEPGAARSILQVRRAAYRPRTATAAAAADHQGSLSGRERRLGSGPTRQDLSLRPSWIRTLALADRHAMAARSKPACSAIASPKGSLTERPGWSTYLPSRWAGLDQAGTALPAARPNHVQIDSYTAYRRSAHCRGVGRPAVCRRTSRSGRGWTMPLYGCPGWVGACPPAGQVEYSNPGAR